MSKEQQYIDGSDPLKVEAIFRTLLSGVPVELTESCPNVQTVRTILEKENPFRVYDEWFDPSGAVFWTPAKSAASLNYVPAVSGSLAAVPYDNDTIV